MEPIGAERTGYSSQLIANTAIQISSSLPTYHSNIKANSIINSWLTPESGADKLSYGACTRYHPITGMVHW